jgi:AcrR family transcriptional regulator
MQKMQKEGCAPPAQPRERILKAAGRLFYEHGYRAIGIDRIIEESDVAKASFYKHFPSKSDLMVAWIETANGYGQRMEQNAIAGRDDPLMAVMEAIVARAKDINCAGCTFQVSASEFPDLNHPAHESALRVKRNMLERLENYARQQNLQKPDEVAAQIYFLIEGIWASSRMFGHTAPFEATLVTAKLIIKAALPS